MSIEGVVTKIKVKVKKLMGYQLNAVEIALSYCKVIFEMITGAGKTLIQAHIIKQDLEINGVKFKIYVIVAPTILLSYQLFKDYIDDVFHPYNLYNSLKIHFFHTGQKMSIIEKLYADKKLNSLPKSFQPSTKDDVLKKWIWSAIIQNRPLLLFTTYESLETLRRILEEENQKITIGIFDEATFLCRSGHNQTYRNLNIDKTYCFCPIIKSGPNGLGLDNPEVFGYDGENVKKVSYSASDSLIDGNMVRPELLTILSDKKYTAEDLDRSFDKILYESCKEIKNGFIKEKMKITPKILVNIQDIGSLKKIMKSKFYQKIIDLGFDIFAIHTKLPKHCNINGNIVTRPNFLDILFKAGEDDNKPMLVLHYEILTRGINVPGLNVWLPFRELRGEGLINTMGRVCRVHPIDGDLKRNGVIGINEYDKMIKPNCFIALPEITHLNSDMSLYYEQQIIELCEYGLEPENVLNFGNPSGQMKKQIPGKDIDGKTLKHIINKVIIKRREIQLENKWRGKTLLERLHLLKSEKVSN
jgi:hypothetical protein